MTEEVLTELDSIEDRPKNEKNKKSAFTRVKERLSIRSKNKNKKSPENIQGNGENKKDSIEKEAVNGTGKNIQPEVSEEKKEEAEKKPKSGGTLERVKMRLSTRNKDGKSGETETKQETLGTNVSVEKETVSADDAKKETEDKTKEEKSKSFLQRIFRFFRSKKNKGNAENQEDEKSGDLAESEEKNEAISSDEDDNEILAICGKEEEEKTPVIPIITTSKPPLPGGRRLPSSATTSHTRPMSQLDEALKQFKLSTAASRENIRNSRQDLSQMEEQVKVELRSRPATPVMAGRILEVEMKTSSSLSDLRQ